MLRINEAPAIDVHVVQSVEPPGGMGGVRDFGHRSGSRQRDLCGHWQTAAHDAGRQRRLKELNPTGK
jgi:hypothetical protein